MLKFLGTGSAFNNELGNTSAYITRGDDLILIDCGSTVFQVVRPVLELAENIHIFITHTHTDHVGSLGTLIDYVRFITKRKVYLYFPSDSIVKMLDILKIAPSAYEISHDMLNTVCGMTFSFFSVDHLMDNCYGFLITDGEKLTLYSGDSNKIPMIEDFLSGEIDTMYLDVSDVPSQLHVTYDELVAQITEPTDRSRLHIMHLNEGFNTERAIADGFNIAEKE